MPEESAPDMRLEKDGGDRPRDFFDLRATHNPNRWYLPVEPGLCVGPPGNTFLFGGVGLASAVTAMERTTERPAIWATAQYLSYARPGSIIDLDVIVPVTGKYNSQARVVGHVGDREIFTVNAALGARPSELSEQWARMPDVPAPEDCAPMPRWPRKDPVPDLHDRLDMRVVKGRFRMEERDGVSEDGHALFWARPKEALPFTSGMVSIIADFIPSAVGNALGKMAGGNSLDNTIRIRTLCETDWVLCDTKIHGVHGGFAHGRMHLFARDGTLMASAGQSMILRIHDPKRWEEMLKQRESEGGGKGGGGGA